MRRIKTRTTAADSHPDLIKIASSHVVNVAEEFNANSH